MYVDAVEMLLDVGLFCITQLGGSERRLFVVYDDRGRLALVLVPRVERVLVAKSVLLYGVLLELYSV